MSVHLRRIGWLFLAGSIAFFAVGFIGAWLIHLGIILFVTVLPAVALLLLVCIVRYGLRGIRLAKAMGPGARLRFVAWLAPLSLLLPVAGALHLMWSGGFVGDWSRLMVNRAEYERIIAAVRANPGDPDQGHRMSAKGITYVVDIGPPVRVAFNPEGLLDNWSGIVFDPTGDVMLADGFDENGVFAAPERITRLFGGDLVSCRRLSGDFYQCGFT